jgi:hypothetical protein
MAAFDPDNFDPGLVDYVHTAPIDSALGAIHSTVIKALGQAYLGLDLLLLDHPELADEPYRLKSGVGEPILYVVAVMHHLLRDVRERIAAQNDAP